MSSITDPYNPFEARYKLTRKSLLILSEHGFEVSILTKSPLVLRDIDLLKNINATVGVSISTNREEIRNIF